ncbi:hypothetical protein OUZ56_006004 [Daphnia magna]|uniref:Uncharacterized protein n=1 Tax=Daphnia magna TaxID=35525 RepID=A0ABQ9YUD1_9CRUS|nr:hypothetical protein OUZ56_006004 [Daphnia magna]
MYIRSSPANHYYSVRPVIRPSGYTTAAPSGRISGPALFTMIIQPVVHHMMQLLLVLVELDFLDIGCCGPIS